MVRACGDADFDEMWAIINDGAEAYRGVIPADRWTEPYMTREKLAAEIRDGVRFSGYEREGRLLGVMGIQEVLDRTLIRHAYVRRAERGLGVGSALLEHLLGTARSEVMIGTWADAVWAIRFYARHGFAVVEHAEKERLLRRYWRVPERQIATSVVLRRGVVAPPPQG